MKDTCSSNTDTPMTIKKLDDNSSKAFWDYVEESKNDWREQQPSWSRDLEQRREPTQAAEEQHLIQA
jgi:hypothetical protein